MERVLAQRSVPLVVAILGLALPAPSAHARACAGGAASPATASTARLEHTTLCLLDAQRLAHGRRPLRAQPSLAAAARHYADSMVNSHFFDHTSPSGSTMMSRVRATAYLKRAGAYSVGENLAWGGGYLGTPRAIVRAWMHSAGHRANLLDPRFRDVGIGIARGIPPGGMAGGTYVTEFGTRR